MQKAIVALAALLLLAGCGRSYHSLPRALAAFRAADYEGFLERTPVVRMSRGENRLGESGCESEQVKMTAALTSGNNSGWEDQERYQVLWEWLGDLKARHGGKFDEKMHDAVMHLEAAGYSAQWPSDLF